MKIGFFNFAPLLYDVSTPLKKPLGGTESAMCYLCMELAKRGHEIILYGRYEDEFELEKVIHKPRKILLNLKQEKLDFFINQTNVHFLSDLKKVTGSKTKIILWEHVTHNQPAANYLSATAGLLHREIRSIVDKFIFVSHWQMDRFAEHFSINPSKSVVMKNAVAPSFENMFPKNKPILKNKRPILVYTSTPFRGLEVLLSLFPEIKKRVPSVILKVFSSMDVYQGMGAPKGTYDHLYKLCKNTDGVKYYGSVSQKKLALELKSALLLTYPCTWLETSGITVMEAMAAGCKVVTTGMAALPETTAGFGYLIPPDDHYEENCKMFINYTVDTLNRLKTQDKKLESELKKQVAFCNQNYIWEKRAVEWEKLLLSIM